MNIKEQIINKGLLNTIASHKIDLVFYWGDKFVDKIENLTHRVGDNCIIFDITTKSELLASRMVLLASDEFLCETLARIELPADHTFQFDLQIA